MNSTKYIILIIFLALSVACSSDDVNPNYENDHITVYFGSYKYTFFICDNDIGIKYIDNVSPEKKDIFEKANNLVYYKNEAPYLFHYKIDGDSYRKSKILSADPIVDYANPIFFYEEMGMYVYIFERFLILLTSEDRYNCLVSLNDKYRVSIIERIKNPSPWYILKNNRPDIYNPIELSEIYRKTDFISKTEPITNALREPY